MKLLLRTAFFSLIFIASTVIIPQGHSATKSCLNVQKQVLNKQKVVAKIVQNTNFAITQAQATYDPSWLRTYLNSYATYTQGVVQMIQIAQSQPKCLSVSKQAQLASSLNQYTQLYIQAISVSPLNMDPGTLRIIAPPKFYEWLYLN